MPFQAQVVNVMIASPGDVAAERTIIRDVVHNWNVVHAERMRIVLLPVGWDTHSYPSFGDRPQSIVNKQVLSRCDLLIAVFWTRLGTPTSEAPSGTVEEINRHIEARKPAMIYFSDAPVRLDSVDAEQYEALRKFRTSCEGRGLIERYSGIEEFADKLRRQIAQVVHEDFAQRALGDLDLSHIVKSDGPVLSNEARRLLLAASHDSQGVVICSRTMDGLSVETNGQNFVDTGNPRSEAKWKAVVDELHVLGLLENRGGHGEVFGVTATAFELAERLERQDTESRKTEETRRPHIQLNAYQFPSVMCDHKTGVWHDRVEQGALERKACVLIFQNNVYADGKGVDAIDLRAQIEWTHDNGSPGPSFSPAAWLDEDYGQIEFPVGWTKKLLIGIRCSNYWDGFDNRRMGAAHGRQSHGEMLPIDGTMVVKLIDRSGILFEAKWKWEENINTNWPHLRGPFPLDAKIYGE